MSKASELVSRAILGEDSKDIYVGGQTFEVYAPTIKSICLSIREFNKADLDNCSYLDVASNFKKIREALISGISFLMCGSSEYVEHLQKLTIDDLNEILKICFTLIDNSDFDVCKFVQERTNPETKVKVVGNKTFLGQIATFIDNLHLSYKEVVEEIPYRVLLIMQRDKLHQSYGDVVEYSNARANRKFKNME